MFVHRWTAEETKFVENHRGKISKEKMLRLFSEKFGIQLTQRQLANKIASLKSVQNEIKATSLCWDCVRACGGAGCPWVDEVDPKPIAGWEFIVKPLKQPVIRKRLLQNRVVNENIVVVGCPLFIGEQSSQKNTKTKLDIANAS